MTAETSRVPTRSKEASSMEMLLSRLTHSHRAVRLIVGLVVVLALPSCSRTTPTGSVAGAVRFAGKPIAAGRITFLCEGGSKPVFFADITDGVYRIESAPVGGARVTVQAFASQPSAPVSTPPAAAPEPPAGTPTMPRPVNLPRIGKPIDGFSDRYLNPKTSGLTCEIKPGPQSQDFDLVP